MVSSWYGLWDVGVALKKTTETGVQSTDIIYAIYIDTRKLRQQ